MNSLLSLTTQCVWFFKYLSWQWATWLLKQLQRGSADSWANKNNKSWWYFLIWVVLVRLEGKSPFVIVIVCWAPDPQFFQVFEVEKAFFWLPGRYIPWTPSLLMARQMTQVRIDMVMKFPTQFFLTQHFLAVWTVNDVLSWSIPFYWVDP